MADGRYLTSANDFKQFVSFCESWRNAFGLTNYRITYEHSHTEDSRAEIRINVEGGTCIITLSTDWDTDKPTKRKIQVAALHEMLHLLFARLFYYVEETGANMKQIRLEEEDIIRRFESLFFGGIEIDG